MEDIAYWEKNATHRPQFDDSVVKVFIEDIISIIKENISNLEHLTLLDCGCGNGRYLHYFNNITKKALGFDYSQQMIKEAKKSGILNVGIDDGMNISHEDNEFDITFGSCYIHNLSSESKAIDEMIRVSKKYIIVIEPNPISLLGLYHLVTPTEVLHSLKFTSSYIKKLLEKAGSKVIFFRKFGYITPNKTPRFLVKFMRSLPFQNIFGFYTITIAEKI